MGLILIAILLALLILSLPTWPYSTGWGYHPSGIFGVILIIILVLVFVRVISFWTVDVKETDKKTTIKIERRD